MTIWSQSPKDYFIIDNLINFFKKNKIKVTIIYQDQKNNTDLNNKLNCDNHKISNTNIAFLNKLFFIYYLLYLIFFIGIKKPNTIIFFNNYPVVITKLIKLFYKGRIIYHNFDYEPQTKNIVKKFLNYFEKKNAKEFNKIIFSNENRAELFKKYSKKSIKVDTIYNCLPKNYFKKFKIKKKKVKKIFRIGTIGPGHGLINLIKSFKYLPDSYQLIICGIVVDKKFHYDLLKIIQKNSIKNKIDIFTSVSQREWMQKMINSDLGVAFYEPINTSHKNMVGASQKINSYLAGGLPILLSNQKQFRLFSQKYRCSINTNSANPFEIAKSIKKLFSNKAKFIKLKRNSKLAFKNYFNFEDQIKKVNYYL